MTNIENQTLEKLINYIGCSETTKTFKQKRSFLFNFSMLWNLFEDRCMNNYAQIRNVEEFVESLNIPDYFEIKDVFNYFKNRYTKPYDGFIYFAGLLWRNTTTEQQIKEQTKSILEDNNATLKSKVKAVLWIVFRLRNNLFHGEKDIKIINEQKETFVLVNRFLIDLIKLQGND